MKMIPFLAIYTLGLLATGCGPEPVSSKSPPQANPAESKEIDYAVSLAACAAPIGRFQATSFATSVCVLDTALGDIYIWRGTEQGWLKCESPLRRQELSK